MLAQSALHETGGPSAAAEALMGSASGAGSKAKKGSGLAGLFSEILSQAQKNLGNKGAKSALEASIGSSSHAQKPKESSPKAGGGASKPESRNAEAQPRKAASSSLSAAELASRSAQPRLQASTQASESPDSKKAATEKQPLSREAKLGSREAQAQDDSPDSKAKAAEEKRRTKAKAETRGDEAAYALVPAKALSPNAQTAKAKAGELSGEADSSINTDEKKKANRSGSKPELTVLDLRRQADAKKSLGSKEAGAETAAVDAAKDSGGERHSPQHSGNEILRELSLDARGAGDASSISGGGHEPSASSSAGADFKTLLAERLQDQWNNEIVQSAHIVLRDGDAGTIRLRLRPESLGNVKIELNLSDNNISGKIVVESDDAKSAFEKNMNSLADAFKQGGFDAARLEVSVGSGSGGGAQAQGGQEGAGPFFSERLRSAVDSSASPTAVSQAYSRRGSAVDLLA